MQKENEKNSFKITYSAKEQEELIRIREKYQPKEESKMDKLRRLDESVTRKATINSLICGIVGALIMGIGMSLIMTDIGKLIGLGNNMTMITGIIIGVIGIILVAFAYPLYNYISRNERKKIAPEVLKLTEELMK